MVGLHKCQTLIWHVTSKKKHFLIPRGHVVFTFIKKLTPKFYKTNLMSKSFLLRKIHEIAFYKMREIELHYSNSLTQSFIEILILIINFLRSNILRGLSQCSIGRDAKMGQLVTCQKIPMTLYLLPLLLTWCQIEAIFVKKLSLHFLGINIVLSIKALNSCMALLLEIP